jgi:hypothetical protein
MRGWMLALAVCSGPTLAACSGSKDPEDTAAPGDTATGTDTAATTAPPPEGDFTLALRFAVDPDYVPYMDEPPVGAFYGTVFRSSEVTGIGPDPDAVALASVVTGEITLPEDGSPTDVVTTVAVSGPVAVTLLGFLDSDDNADPGAPDPDDNDPVTLPFQNAFEGALEAETEITVFFGLLNP